MPAGRPTNYTPELGDLICEGVARKTPMAKLCDENKKLPSARTVYRWLREHEEFCQNYMIAKDDQADYLAEESIDIADNQVSQPVMADGAPLMIDGKPVMTTDSASVAHARLRVDTRKWYASKLKPKKYGDQIALTGKKGEPPISVKSEGKEELIASILGLVKSKADPEG